MSALNELIEDALSVNLGEGEPWRLAKDARAEYESIQKRIKELESLEEATKEWIVEHDGEIPTEEECDCKVCNLRRFYAEYEKERTK